MGTNTKNSLFGLYQNYDTRSYICILRMVAQIHQKKVKKKYKDLHAYKSTTLTAAIEMLLDLLTLELL